MTDPVRVYPFSEEEADVGLTLTVGGRPVPLHAARVSAWPINRRWPGFQRPQSQTETVGFAGFELSGPAEVTVRTDRPVAGAVVRPRSRGIETVCRDGEIRFTLPGPGAYVLETGGPHGALHLFADAPGAPRPDPADPGLIYFGPGIHDAGEIELKSGQTLFLDEGAVVYARVVARDAENICIAGRGILDGSRTVEKILRPVGEKEIAERERGWAVSNAVRVHQIQLEYCTGVTIRDVTVRDSLLYAVRPVCCRDLTVENVKIVGNWRYNSDGIDMHNCEDVTIRGCFVRTYDDCICVKGFDYTQNEADMDHGGRRYDAFRNVLVEDCVIWCDWGRCLEIGAETRAREICGVVFRNCDLIRVQDVACDVQNVDYGDVHDVLFEDIRAEMDGRALRPMLQRRDEEVYAEDPADDFLPMLLCATVCEIAEYSVNGRGRGRNRRITFRNVSVSAPRMPLSAFNGFDEAHRTEDVTVEGLRLNGKRVRTAADANIQIKGYVSGFRFV